MIFHRSCWQKSALFVYARFDEADLNAKSRRKTMDSANLKERIKAIASKREFLAQLLEKPNLGTLRLDVTQALEELDELLDEFKLTFPEEAA